MMRPARDGSPSTMSRSPICAYILAHLLSRRFPVLSLRLPGPGAPGCGHTARFDGTLARAAILGPPGAQKAPARDDVPGGRGCAPEAAGSRGDVLASGDLRQ